MEKDYGGEGIRSNLGTTKVMKREARCGQNKT